MKPQMSKVARYGLMTVIAGMGVMLMTDPVFAGTAQGLPWEGALTKFVDSMTGPVALGISVLGFLGLGALLIFQAGEMNQVLKTFIFLLMAVALVVSAASLVSLFFGFSGAEIQVNEQIGVMVEAVKAVPGK